MITLSNHQLSQIGKILRKQRKRMEKSMKYFADDILSEASISRIENGKNIPSLEKYAHYAEKLGINFEELIESSNDIVELSRVRSTLDSIEEDIEDGFLSEASESLNDIELGNQDFYKPFYHYLKGKLFIYKNQMKQGEKELLTSISSSESFKEDPIYEELRRLNILPCSYYALATVYYSKNDLKAALTTTEKALNSFLEDGERQDYYYKILMNQAVFLQKLDRVIESEFIVEELSHHIDHIQDQIIKTGYYELKALIYKKKDLFEEAIEYTQKGLRIARQNKLFDRIFELRTLLGNIYSEIDRIDEAEHAYKRSLLLSSRIENKRIIPTTHTLLGHFYLKQSKFDLAKSHFDEAIQVCENANVFDSRYAAALNGLGVLLYHAGEKMAAVEPLEKALKICQLLDLKEKEQKIILALIKCYEGIDEKKYQNCLKRLSQICIELKGDYLC